MTSKEFYSERNMRLLIGYFLRLKSIIEECDSEIKKMHREFESNTGLLKFTFFGRGISGQKFIWFLGDFFLNRPKFWNYDISRIKSKQGFLRKARVIKAGIKRLEKILQKGAWKKLPLKSNVVKEWLDSTEYNHEDTLSWKEKEYIGYDDFRKDRNPI